MVDSIIEAGQIANPDLKEATLTNIKYELLEILFDYSSRFQTKYEKAKATIKEKLLEDDINIDDYEKFINDYLIPFYAKLPTMYKSYEEMLEGLDERTKISPRFIAGIKIGTTISFDYFYYTFHKKEIESYDEFEKNLVHDIAIKSDVVESGKERELKKELKNEGLGESDFDFLDEQHKIAHEYYCYFSQFI